MDGRKWVGECPVCRYYSWLWQESEKPGVSPEEAARLQAAARELKPIERYYYNVIADQKLTKRLAKNLKTLGQRFCQSVRLYIR